MHNGQNHKNMALRNTRQMAVRVAVAAALIILPLSGVASGSEANKAEATPAVVIIDATIQAPGGPSLRDQGAATAEFVNKKATEAEVAAAERAPTDKRGRTMVW
ncbi:MAG: hypothetical protein RBS88_11255 [Spongiibacteraceae bacterium]|jgi:hypothetical protein|nr:hypothetical protein [Spongiibacteraceae bacterium]